MISLAFILYFITNDIIMEKKKELLQALPKVDEAIASITRELHEKVPAMLLKKIVRQAIDEERQKILHDAESYSPLDTEKWFQRFREKASEGMQHNLRRVINGTGVVIHTNLGRSLLSSEAALQLLQCGRSYTNLEFDLQSGKRGSRYALVEELICDLTGAEAALVVNNNAAAVLLVIETLAKDREAIVSRGELVEIGGSFRIPDVMAKSGATLVEVGATNRTHIYDYERALTEATALLLKVHTSNFRMIGFTKEVSTEELVRLAREYDVTVMEDLGSGCLLDLSDYGLPRERTVQEVVDTGVDIVTFSGDKLLGGPQAGIIVGRKRAIDRIKKNPLNRALRIDKLTLASLESVLRCYFDPSAAREKIPTLRMLTEDRSLIKKRAQKVLSRLKKKKVGNCSFTLLPTISQTGGGAIPEYGLESWALALQPANISVNGFERDMRNTILPLVGRIEKEHFLIDFRTVQDDDVDDLTELLSAYFSR